MFDAMYDALLASALGADITYTPAGGFAAPLRVLIDDRDIEANLGAARAAQDVLFFKVKVADLATIRPNDTFSFGGRTYQVRDRGELGARGLIWHVSGYRIS